MSVDVEILFYFDDAKKAINLNGNVLNNIFPCIFLFKQYRI